MGRYRKEAGLSRRALGLMAGGLVATTMSPASAGHTAGGEFDPTPYVHPQLRPLLAQIKSQFGSEPTTAANLAAVRKMDHDAPIRPAPAWTTRMIQGRKGAPDVRVYVINPGQAGEAKPAILYIHGGGFITGTAKRDVGRNQVLAAALGCVMVSVDYRLAPETPFPGALDDNYAALAWLHQHAEELGVDRQRIAVMGGSAGGGHAAMLTIAARDRGEFPIAYQCLIAPMLDDRTGSTRKKPPYMGAVIWDPVSNAFGWSSLLGVPAGSATIPVGSVPARIENLKGLPPAFIGVGSIDLFVDEDIEYARRLMEAGIAVRLNVVPGAFHGFFIVENAPIVKAFQADMIASLAEGLQISL